MEDRNRRRGEGVLVRMGERRMGEGENWRLETGDGVMDYNDDPNYRIAELGRFGQNWEFYGCYFSSKIA
jgi:hypothetical protein